MKEFLLIDEIPSTISGPRGMKKHREIELLRSEPAVFFSLHALLIEMTDVYIPKVLQVNVGMISKQFFTAYLILMLQFPKILCISQVNSPRVQKASLSQCHPLGAPGTRVRPQPFRQG